MRLRGRGITLIEVLVSLSLVSIVTLMILALFVPSMSLFRRQTGKSDSYRGCLMLLEKFRVGLMNSQMETVTISPTGHAISWQMIEDDPPFSASTGDALMSPEFAILYYKEDEKRVYYKLYNSGTSGPPDQPSFLSLSDLNTAIGSPSNKTYVIGRNITEFRITDKDGDVTLLEPPLTLTIKSEIDTEHIGNNDSESFRVQASVTPRSMRW